MTDLRARLADAAMKKYGGVDFTDYSWRQVIDLLLSLPGIAIVDTELIVLVLRHKQVAFGREDEVAAAVIAVAAANAAKRC